MCLLANENIPIPTIHLLRQAGYDITAITEDSPGIPDTVVLGRAGYPINRITPPPEETHPDQTHDRPYP